MLKFYSSSYRNCKLLELIFPELFWERFHEAYPQHKQEARVERRRTRAWTAQAIEDFPSRRKKAIVAEGIGVNRAMNINKWNFLGSKE